MYTSKTSFKTTVEWSAIPWRKHQRRVFKLQKRIYKASQRGDVKAVKRLQKTLLHSWSAKCLAVRRVTQDNQGKKTAGVDGVKSLSPSARLTLVNSLKLGNKAAPTRRVWIPKPGSKGEKRPLSIPTIYDRALQSLVKLALEPEWEARFESNSFGFRPGRSAHDAIEAIFSTIKFKPKYVLDADISKCFDRINHNVLLSKLNTFPTIYRQIRAWLKAGVIDFSSYANREKSYSKTTVGTPQGGTISPLLANVALHGMENRIKQFAETFPGYKRGNRNAISLIRFADDFVILHENLAVILNAKQIISEWLNGIGLELKPSKTRISHTLNKYEGNLGFSFLGFTVRQFPVGKCHSGKNSNGKMLGFKTIITPSKTKLNAHTRKIGKLIDRHKSVPQSDLIAHLNPIIRGWTSYYSSVVSKRIFNSADTTLFSQLKAWAEHRHPNKSSQWCCNKYWQTIGFDNWVFKPLHQNICLLKHRETSIVRYIKVQAQRSPFDGDWVYWSSRMGKYPEAPTRVATLLKTQKGKCAYCGLFFHDGDLMEIDHKIPRLKGGTNSYSNLQLLHGHCHDAKTTADKVAVRVPQIDEDYLNLNPF
ncbi:DNA polymerase [Hapalosiphon sp. MRB220]|nr:DNA polymerase [Hapalosiphon sp. MRB220]